jgi:hypothetical protein
VQKEDRRAVWLGAVIAAIATLLLTIVAASLESTINRPGTRTIGEPLLWAIGGGVGITLGAVVTAWITRRIGPAALAGLGGALVLLVLIVAGFNSSDLRFEDQLVGTLLVVVVPAYVGSMVCATFAALAARAFTRAASFVTSSSRTS